MKGFLMNKEIWIWTELLAFDNTASDLGVTRYLTECGELPYGISLLLSAADFVVLHQGMEREYSLFADVCTRFGHDGNGIRSRQNWTNYQLRKLIKLLQNKKIKVFFSVFASYFNNQYHQEWASSHREVFLYYDDLGETPGINVLARLKDGTYYEDIFSEKLKMVMTDYCFDGFHGPDYFGPGEVIAHNDCSDSFIGQFIEYLGERCPDELKIKAGNDISLLAGRMKFIWQNLHADYIRFNIERWTSFWKKIIAVLRELGKESMINSAWTKSAMESMYIYGIDYRRIAELGLDYLVVETCAGGLALINGGHDFYFDFAATLAEMKAFLPKTKVIFLHGVKDVVESYDILKHAPGRLEREFFTLSNIYMVSHNHLVRCADGFLVCLGDGLTGEDWTYLRSIWNIGFGFAAEQAGDITWLWDNSTIDALLDEYPRLGTWPGFKQISALMDIGGVNIQTIARFEELEGLSGAIIVPNADLLPPEKLEKLKQYQRGAMVLMGNLTEEMVSLSAGNISCRISENYCFRCAVFGGKPSRREIVEKGLHDYEFCQPPLSFWIPGEYQSIPDVFWEKAGALINEILNLTVEAAPSCRDLRFLKMYDAKKKMRLALVSRQATYFSPVWNCTAEILSVEKCSVFPYLSLTVRDNHVFTNSSCDSFRSLHIPPFGIIAMDICTGKPSDSAAKNCL